MDKYGDLFLRLNFPAFARCVPPVSFEIRSLNHFFMKNSSGRGFVGAGLFRKKSGFETWWTHIWSGLVRDPSGKHHRTIGPAIWLYLYFVICADWKTGKLFRKLDTIAAETGFSRRSIERWLAILRKAHYVETRSNGRSLDVLITKWRPISRKIASRTYTNV